MSLVLGKGNAGGETILSFIVGNAYFSFCVRVSRVVGLGLLSFILTIAVFFKIDVKPAFGKSKSSMQTCDTYLSALLENTIISSMRSIASCRFICDHIKYIVHWRVPNVGHPNALLENLRNLWCEKKAVFHNLPGQSPSINITYLFERG